MLIQPIVLPVKPSFSDVSVAVEVVIFLNSLMTVTTTVSTCAEYITTSAILILPQGVVNYAGFYYLRSKETTCLTEVRCYRNYGEYES